MASARKTKRDQQFDKARSAAAAGRSAFLDPAMLFGRASNDDLAQYTPEMLAAAAARAAEDLAAWDRKTARVKIAPVDGIAPNEEPVTVLSVTTVNRPFLYDSVMGEVTSTHRDIHLAVHPILSTDKTGATVLKSQAGADGVAISYIQLHLAELPPAQAEALAERLKAVLDQVTLAANDWEQMLGTLEGAVEQLKTQAASRGKVDRDEAIAFLEWLRDDNFTFLGMRDYLYSGTGDTAEVKRDEGTGLGILSDPKVLVLRQGHDAVTTTPEILKFLQGPEFLIVTKANVKSVVHRRAYMDYIGIKRFDADGHVTGELRIVGLFTATAYTRSVNRIPLLRAKIDTVIAHFGFDPQSHSGRMLQNTLESYPRDDLFQIDADMLIRFSEQIMDLAERPRVRVLPRIDQFDRFVSLLVYVPKEEYNSAVREKIGTYFKNVYDGRVSAYYPAFPEGGVARVHFIIGRSDRKTPVISQAKLEEAVRAITTPWRDRFEALAGHDALSLNAGTAYQEAFSAEEAVADLKHIEGCLHGTPISIAFHEQLGDTGPIVYLKIFHSGSHLPLSRRVPLLENLGFSVISERTFDIYVVDADGTSRLVVLHDMELQGQNGRRFDFDKDAALAEAAIVDAFTGTVDNDRFNRLVLSAGLTAREVTVLRAYGAYLRQAGVVYTQSYIADTLNKYPGIATLLFSLFRDAFDPETSERTRKKQLKDTREAIETALADVPILDEDRILRRYLNAIEATLRTNYFQRDANGQPKPMLAFKFDPKQVEGLPQPRPFREIFVFGVEVEGVHLRFGKVARGGLRWSDRAQDYRTEVLGLVKAQQVKNAVIVPVGAKGGFYPKQLPTTGPREDWLTAGKDAYKTFISTMLSITDNIVDGKVVPPADTLRLDEDDPYFVVAADKGTATFSDTANGLAQAAGFWLDDAFASGGSAGYDHKKMGITARGAWEAAKRHFREMDVDIQTTPFTVAGVGDMSGDVFGNGMLLSQQIRLIAAFDHRDIFIDPDPDTAKSFAERKRMFDLPRSSWQDYDRAALSEGAMIISRAEKSVTLTPQAQAAIGLPQAKATPFDIMTAILKAKIDLLWFGGIGTYIKAAGESDAEVGDRTNDPIRITAAEVGAKVIGEGANLGVTQKGRIAYALAGGRVNSDAIDNSAGVNSSDVEVNIKIALAPALADGRLSRPKRDKLLAEMTEEVGHLVLRNNYLQTLAISLTEGQGRANREPLARLMTTLEAAGHLDRKIEMLPDDATFGERYASGKSLTRPEIGVLLSYAKITLFDQLVASDLPDDPYCLNALMNYFPNKMRKAYRDDILHHRLHREIIATVLANHVINRGGPGFVVGMTDATGALPAAVVKAALLVRDGLDLPAIWEQIDALDAKIPGHVQNTLYAAVGRAYETMTRLMLETKIAAGDMSDVLTKLKTTVEGLRSGMEKVLPDHVRDAIAGETEALVASGVPADLAGRITALETLVIAPEAMEISEVTKTTMPKVVEGYFAVTGAFQIDRLLDLAARTPTADHYDSQALMRAIDRIGGARRRIVIVALQDFKREREPIAAWQQSDRTATTHAASELRTIAEGGEASLARIAVAAALLGDLAHERAT
ncbi:NAD-glutamate dehydrogenase [Rhizobium halophytocola]|uniref:Glutamate dehydrogenase n=1 Tax=Rhizobium halophytocola TaxID=735519 RepID=A0ABS4E1Q0_9HYPH|nr:NAD-glutamate dehydrogenase [Rhizobium halophytocola]MBP1851873.1 glutamate dehydrogenase [Rhizobium halophytocola]